MHYLSSLLGEAGMRRSITLKSSCLPLHTFSFIVFFVVVGGGGFGLQCFIQVCIRCQLFKIRRFHIEMYIFGFFLNIRSGNIGPEIIVG